MRALTVVLAACLLMGTAGAAAAQYGMRTVTKDLYDIELTDGVADFATLPDRGFITATSHTEVGLQLQWWHFLREDYAVSLSGGLGWFKEVDKPGTDAPAGSKDFTYSQLSWNARLGGDRFAPLAGRLRWFAGPGLALWAGRPKFDDGTTTLKLPVTRRVALDARIGVLLQSGSSMGMSAWIGHYLGYAWAEDQGAKAQWWPSGAQGALGVQASF